MCNNIHCTAPASNVSSSKQQVFSFSNDVVEETDWKGSFPRRKRRVKAVGPRLEEFENETIVSAATFQVEFSDTTTTAASSLAFSLVS